MPTPMTTETPSNGDLATEAPDYSTTTNDMFSSGVSVNTEPPVATDPPEDSNEVEGEARPKGAPSNADPVATKKAVTTMPNVLDENKEDENTEEETVAKPDEKKVSDASKGVKKETAAERRKYEGIDPSDAEILRKSPNHVYSALAPRLKNIPVLEARVKELETELSQSNVERDYMNPEGFKLTPEYTSLSNASSNMETELEYYKEALRHAENGRQVFRLKAKTDDLSKPDMGYHTDKNDIIPKDEARAYALENLTAAKSRLEQFTNQRQSFQVNYINQNKSFVEMARGAATKYFPYLEDSALQDKPEIKEQLQAMRHLLGPLSRGMGGELTARAIYALQHIHKKYTELEARLKTKENTLKKVGRADPLRYGATSNDDKTTNDIDPDDIYKGTTNADFEER